MATLPMKTIQQKTYVWKYYVAKMTRSECKVMQALLDTRIQVLNKPALEKAERIRRQTNIRSLEWMFDDFEGGTESQRDALLEVLVNGVDCDALVFVRDEYYDGDCYAKYINFTCDFLPNSYCIEEVLKAGGNGWSAEFKEFEDVFECKTMQELLASCTVLDKATGLTTFDATRVDVKVLMTSVLGAYYESNYHELFDVMIAPPPPPPSTTATTTTT